MEMSNPTQQKEVEQALEREACGQLIQPLISVAKIITRDVKQAKRMAWARVSNPQRRRAC